MGTHTDEYDPVFSHTPSKHIPLPHSIPRTHTPITAHHPCSLSPPLQPRLMADQLLSSTIKPLLTYLDTMSSGIICVSTLDVDMDMYIQTNNLIISFDWSGVTHVHYCVALFNGEIHPYCKGNPTTLR